MRLTKPLVPLFGILVAVIWGLTFLSIKVSVREMGPMSLAFSRFLIASLILPLIAVASKTSLKIRLKDLPLAAFSGLMGITFYFFFENNGIMKLSASESSIIIGTIPVLTLIVDFFIYKQRPSAAVMVGILLSFLGVGLMVLRSEAAMVSPEGYLFMVGAAVSWVLYSFLTKPLSGAYPLLAITFWQIFFGTLGCLPFAMGERQDFSQLSLSVILNVLYLGVLASAFGYWLYVIVLDNLGASRSSVFINLIPVVSIVASFVLLGERLAPLQLAGGAVTIAGVYLATATRTRRN